MLAMFWNQQKRYCVCVLGFATTLLESYPQAGVVYCDTVFLIDLPERLPSVVL